ncbi:MAG: hypothetical protein OXT09_23070 [Myxococcales bacterium]|nr:hypothetical protein [Myxococcales bacterium]
MRSVPTALALWVLLAACASGPEAREDRLSAGFAQIQVHEARLAEADAARARAGDCTARCDAHRQVCTESDALCEIAGQLEDADALARCDQARPLCQAEPTGCEC